MGFSTYLGIDTYDIDYAERVCVNALKQVGYSDDEISNFRADVRWQLEETTFSFIFTDFSDEIIHQLYSAAAKAIEKKNIKVKVKSDFVGTSMWIDGKAIGEKWKYRVGAEKKSESQKVKRTFDSNDLEKHIPYHMRFKSCEILEDEKALYWVTQCFFTANDLKTFQEAISNYTDIDKAYVTVRDFSSYEFEDDKARNVLAIITRDSIDYSGYLDEVKQRGITGIDLQEEVV